MDIPSATVLGHREPELVPETWVYARGDLASPKEKVTASLPSFLGGGDLSSADCTGRCVPLARKKLALWLTQPDHPRLFPVTQAPCGVIPMAVTSYLWGSSTDNTERADMSETSCSPERPPNKIPKRTLPFTTCLCS